MSAWHKPERDAVTGAVVAWEPWPIAKFVIFNCHGEVAGYRRDMQTAREFAASLPGKPYQPAAPPALARSPRATPPPELEHLPRGLPYPGKDR